MQLPIASRVAIPNVITQSFSAGLTFDSEMAYIPSPLREKVLSLHCSLEPCWLWVRREVMSGTRLCFT